MSRVSRAKEHEREKLITNTEPEHTLATASRSNETESLHVEPFEIKPCWRVTEKTTIKLIEKLPS